VRAGDLLIVDEAGMLDQDTARALFTIAGEHQVRVALLGTAISSPLSDAAEYLTSPPAGPTPTPA
jgi:ATP-dependent exoDNAse (exonuclease V) alpha subunit